MLKFVSYGSHRSGLVLKLIWWLSYHHISNARWHMTTIHEQGNFSIMIDNLFSFEGLTRCPIIHDDVWRKSWSMWLKFRRSVALWILSHRGCFWLKWFLTGFENWLMRLCGSLCIRAIDNCSDQLRTKVLLGYLIFLSK